MRGSNIFGMCLLIVGGSAFADLGAVQWPTDVPTVVGTAIAEAPARPGANSEWAIRLTLPKITWEVTGNIVPKEQWPELKVEVAKVTQTLRMGGPSALVPSRVVDVEGNELDRDQVLERLKKEIPVYVSISGRMPDPYFLQLARPDSLIIILGPRDGSPAPDLLPSRRTSEPPLVPSEEPAERGSMPGQAKAIADWDPLGLPANRHGHRVHLVGDELLVIGGFSRDSDSSESSRSCLGYDFAAGQWRQAASFHTGKAFFGSVMVDGHVYAIGENIERYDLAQDMWEVVSNHPGLPTSHFSAAAIGSDIYIVGHKLWIFNTRTGAIVEHAPWPDRKSGDHFHVVAALNETLHVIGGLDGETYDASSRHWTWRNGTWSRQPDAPEPMFAKLSVVEVVDGRLYVLGPDHSFVLDGQSLVWRRLAPIPETLVMAGSFVRHGMIHVTGGLATQQDHPRFCYDPVHNQWSFPDR
jgi:Kelch motif